MHIVYKHHPISMHTACKRMIFFFLRATVALLFYFYYYSNYFIISCVPIDNGVEGEPEIECGSNSVSINFNTKNPFQGRVYVKGRFEEPGCLQPGDGIRRTASLNISFGSCGTDRGRSLSPKGVNVFQTVVITFHPQFLTKVDRAYVVQCFYMEADKFVSQDLQVSELTTEFAFEQVKMPTCRYEIFEAPPAEGQQQQQVKGQQLQQRQLVKYASIGQPVYHQWTCDSNYEPNIFCMRVYGCTVDDGSGNVARLVDDEGCALDKYLLQNLEYTSDLSAGREAHVFKYADKPALIFTSQIAVTVKEPGTECPRPQCKIPDGGGDQRELPKAATGSPKESSPKNKKSSPDKPAVTKRIEKQIQASKSPILDVASAQFKKQKKKLNLLRHRVKREGSPMIAENYFKSDFNKNNSTVWDEDDDDGEEFLGIWDVRSQTITALDLDWTLNSGDSNSNSSSSSFDREENRRLNVYSNLDDVIGFSSPFCVRQNSTIYRLFVSATVGFIILALLFLVAIVSKKFIRFHRFFDFFKC